MYHLATMHFVTDRWSDEWSVKNCKTTDFIEVNVDGANEGGADGSEGEESMLPAADVHHTFIEIKQTLQPANYTRIHTKQLPYKQNTQ